MNKQELLDVINSNVSEDIKQDAREQYEKLLAIEARNDNEGID